MSLIGLKIKVRPQTPNPSPKGVGDKAANVDRVERFNKEIAGQKGVIQETYITQDRGLVAVCVMENGRFMNMQLGGLEVVV